MTAHHKPVDRSAHVAGTPIAFRKNGQQIAPGRLTDPARPAAMLVHAGARAINRHSASPSRRLGSRCHSEPASSIANTELSARSASLTATNGTATDAHRLRLP